MAEAGNQLTPHASGCAVSKQSRIPKLSPRAPQKEVEAKNVQRTSKLPAPTSRAGLRKSTSQMNSGNVVAPTNGTRSSISESTIPKKITKPSLKAPSSPRRAISPRTLRPLSAYSNLRPSEIKQGVVPKKINPSNDNAKAVPEKTLEDISDAIFERACGTGEQVPSIMEEKPPSGVSDSDSSSEGVPDNKFSLSLAQELGNGNFVSSGVDAQVLDEVAEEIVCDTVEREVQRNKENNLLEKLDMLEAEDDIRLITEKQQLLDDMQSLKEKLDKQQESSSKESSSDREQELEEKLKVKQEEVESVNQKFSELVDEQQKLLNKVSQQSGENSGFGNALLAAVLAVLLGIGYLLWQSR